MTNEMKLLTAFIEAQGYEIEEVKTKESTTTCLNGSHPPIEFERTDYKVTKNEVIKLSHVSKRHGTRWWLKALPDADLLKYEWVACDEDGRWCCYGEAPVWDSAYGFFTRSHGVPDLWKGAESMMCLSNLPTLKGDEWKDSCINLREWQASTD